ncbi:hypothetical protein [Bowmanella dokdonensis]|uniref:Uncharacterized protein n=1 Tax=Bowmanella dokdonensis TaxID=751969 RepID=A0A939DND9_9ALTE|nr:hypothetical protein [Bowmanella dokdonensis]MBN7825832.1 hypothetical protein [Bowmanella dokdonensis]
MQRDFLCPPHRAWLSANPDFVMSHFNRWWSAAQCFRYQEQWEQALPFLGCAFETIELLLKQPRAQDRMWVVQLTATAILLADTFSKLHRNEEGWQVIHRTRDLLTELVQRHRDLWQTCQKCLKTLKEASLSNLQGALAERVSGGLH